jgi:hypothetical protein
VNEMPPGRPPLVERGGVHMAAWLFRIGAFMDITGRVFH